MRLSENQKKGVYVPKKTVQKQIKEEEGERVRDLLRTVKKEGELTSVQTREKVYRKNMGIE